MSPSFTTQSHSLITVSYLTRGEAGKSNDPKSQEKKKKKKDLVETSLAPSITLTQISVYFQH